MHTVYRAENLFDAHLVKDALEAGGIPAFIAGEYPTGGVGQLPAMDYIAVMVPESGLAEAGGIVREVEARLVEARQAIGDELPDDPLAAPCWAALLGAPWRLTQPEENRCRISPH
jgi:hypothetical protein